MPGGRTIVADPGHAVGRRHPFAVPVADTTVADPFDRGRAFAKVGPAISRLKQRALAERLVHRNFA